MDDAWVPQFYAWNKRAAEGLAEILVLCTVQAKSIAYHGTIMVGVFWAAKEILLIDYLKKLIIIDLNRKTKKCSSIRIIYKPTRMLWQEKNESIWSRNCPNIHTKLSPSDLSLFLNLKKLSTGELFEWNEVMIAAVAGYLQTVQKLTLEMKSIY